MSHMGHHCNMQMQLKQKKIWKSKQNGGISIVATDNQ